MKVGQNVQYYRGRQARCVWNNAPCAIDWAQGVISEFDILGQTEHQVARDQLYVAPGFIDLQINGYAGINFADPNITLEQLQSLMQQQFEVGVTSLLPTFITDSFDVFNESLKKLTQLITSDKKLNLAMPGFHLEGPYMSDITGPRGAHPAQHCRDPQIAELQQWQASAQGRVKLMTLAPERKGSAEFIQWAREQGILISLGHSAANDAQVEKAVQAGAKISTHLGNGLADQIQRHRNVMFAQLAHDDLWASLIVDGHHLPHSLLKIYWRTKQPERIVLVSDAVQYAGMPAGIYDGGFQQIEVRDDGFVGIHGEPRLAGSGMNLLQGVENLHHFMDCSLATAWKCASTQPAQLMQWDDTVGNLAVGQRADLVFFTYSANGSIDIQETYLAGEQVYGA